MTKKITLLTLVLVLGLSFSIYASDKTIADEEWDNFFQTANLEYTAHHGEFTSTLGVNVPDPAYINEFDYIGSLTQLTYSLTDNLEISGYFNPSTDDVYQQFPNGYTRIYSGSIKDKFFVTGPLTLAAKGTITYNQIPDQYLYNMAPGNFLSLNGKLYSNLSLGRLIKLYNNFSYTRVKYDSGLNLQGKSMANCVELNLGKTTTLRAIANTSLNDLNNLEPVFSAILRSQPVKGITFITDGVQSNNGSQDYIRINNVLELKPLASTVLTGQFQLGYPANIIEPIFSVNVSQKLGFLTLKAGYEGNLPNSYYQFATISGEAKINFTKNFGIGLEAYQDQGYWGDSLYLRAKLHLDM